MSKKPQPDYVAKGTEVRNQQGKVVHQAPTKSAATAVARRMGGVAVLGPHGY